MHKYKSSKFPHFARTVVQFDDMDQSTLANICRVAAERFGDHAKEFRKLIDYKPATTEPQSDEAGRLFVDMTPHGEGARRLAEQFERQATEARAFADLFEGVDSIPDMVMDADEEEEAA